MNWFGRQILQGCRLISDKSFDISISAAKGKMEKTAAYNNRSHDVEYSVYENNDGYSGRVQLVENKNKIVLSARVLNKVYHFPLLEERWHYGMSERARALKTFNRVVNVMEDMKVEIENDETPGPILQGIMREEMRFIDVDRKKGTRNRSLEASKFEPGESDWRSSLYGNRYPSPPISITNHGDIYL